MATGSFDSYIPELGVVVHFATHADPRCMECHKPCDLVEEAKPLTDPPTDWHVSHCCRSVYSGLSEDESIQVTSVTLRGLELIGVLTLGEIAEFEEEARDNYECE